MNSNEIARKLGIRPSTADAHVQPILRKPQLQRCSDLMCREWLGGFYIDGGVN